MAGLLSDIVIGVQKKNFSKCEAVIKLQQENTQVRYYIADCHFFHKAMLDRMDKRGFADVEVMNNYMIEKWNNKVRTNDEVVILGDFSWGKAEPTNEILKQLNGTLYLIKGNHDHYLNNAKFDASRFVWVKDYAEIHDRKRKVILSHYPIMCYNGQYRLDKKGKALTYMLYGHVHDTTDQRLLEMFQEKTRSTSKTALTPDGEKEMYIPCNMINCFCMYSDYEPLTLDEWIECQEKRLKKNAPALF